MAAHDAGIRASSLLSRHLRIGGAPLPPALLSRFFRQAKFRRSPPPTSGSAVLQPSSTLAAGEAVICVDAAVAAQLATAPLPGAPAAGRHPALRVVRASSELVIVSKPPGVHSQDPRSGVLASLPALEASLGAPRGSLRPVHRLDTPVGGLLCLARTLDATRRLSAALREGASGSSFLRRYVGLVSTARVGQGLREGVLTVPVAPRGGASGPLVGPGLPAATRFRVAGEGAAANGSALTALLLSPLTGRRHQLRQHVAVARGALLGDVLYGARGAQGALGGRGAIGLHAAALRITDCGGGGDAAVEVMDELPPPWAPLLARHGMDAAALLRQLLPFLREVEGGGARET